MDVFVIFKTFNTTLHPPKAHSIKEVICSPPYLDWIKCNVEGTYTSNLCCVRYECIFRDHNGSFLSNFVEHLMWDNSLLAKLCGLMRLIRIARDKGWSRLWVKCGSFLIIKVFTNIYSDLVHTESRNVWNAWIRITIKYIFSNHFAHI